LNRLTEVVSRLPIKELVAAPRKVHADSTTQEAL
jgi:hypothetical protein